MIVINVLKLTELLSNETDKVMQILESLGYENIRYNKTKNYLVYPRIGGDNLGSTILYLDNLNIQCFTRNDESGNLYTAVMREKDLNFPQALEYIVKELKLEKDELNKEIKYPFGGFYKNLLREIQEPEMSMKTYDESILDEYSNKYTRLFFEDGISYLTQEKYNIGYDFASQRITIPEYTLDGKLCGIMGRLNDSECGHEERWFPIIPCSRNLTLFSYHRNYQNIQNKGLCIVGESEKFPQQLDSFGCYLGLGACGCHLSDVQTKYLKGLLIPKIILAFDEGLEEEYIRSQAEKLKIDNAIIKNNVGYIWDDENIILKKDSKSSPSDFGKDKFSYLIKNKVKWL